MVALRSRDPFGAVLEALRGQIRGGQLPPGEPLIVMDLARALGISATPVREGLAYLAGEGLIDGRRGRVRGYATWRLSAADLADLYRLHSSNVLFALAEAGRRGARLGLRDALDGVLDRGSDAGALARAAEGLFDALLLAGGNGVARRAHRAVADRLHLARLREPAVLDHLAEELHGLAALEAGGVLLAQAVRTYHRRRLAEAEPLVAAMVRSGG